jgi:biotin synthase
MLAIDGLSPDDLRLTDARSLLISGGCDRWGRVPVTTHLDTIRALRHGRRLNWHVGLIQEQDLQAISELVDVVSFDLVGDDATISEVYGFDATVDDYRSTYRLLRQHVSVIPHITIGLRGGKISGERQALHFLEREGADAIVFIIFIPTPNTLYADRRPPPVEEVARILAEARLAFPTTPLLLGCMRPGGLYRQEIDPLAVRVGINHIVKPNPAALALAEELGLEILESTECCTLALQDSLIAPTHLRVSAGTEVVLGLRRRPMDAAPSTAYLMLEGGRCAMNCAFCAQARDSHARTDALSRIIWPDHSTEAVIARLKEVPEELRRVCLQVTVHRGAVNEVKSLVQAIRGHIPQPISAAILPPNIEAIEQLLEAGVDVVGLGLDAANERVYRAVKGAGWKGMIALIENACQRFPNRIRVHLMVGLGETEEEFCRTMQQIYDWGGAASLFAFTPVRGTPLQDRPQPPLDTYRRLQVARYLIHHGLAHTRQFHFDQGGRLVDFGRPDLPELLADGGAFRTSGCPDCNRPFYNERPGGTMYNYAQPLEPQEIEQALKEIGLP